MSYDAKDCTYLINRDRYQNMFSQAYEDAGFNYQGYPEHPAIRAKAHFAHNAGAQVRLPNFILTSEDWSEDGPWANYPKYIDLEKNIIIDWYKAPIRFGRSNKPLSESDITDTLERFVTEAKNLM